MIANLNINMTTHPSEKQNQLKNAVSTALSDLHLSCKRIDFFESRGQFGIQLIGFTCSDEIWATLMKKLPPDIEGLPGFVYEKAFEKNNDRSMHVGIATDPAFLLPLKNEERME
jgi:hypothetical protein